MSMALGSFICRLEGVVQLLDDGGVHAFRSGDAEGRIEHEGIPELLQRRGIGQTRVTLLRPEHEPPHPARIYVWPPAGDASGVRHDVPALERRRRLGAAFE